MIIDDILKDAKMSRYKLSKVSGVPQTTISGVYLQRKNKNGEMFCRDVV